MSDTPRTDEVPHNVAELAMHARKLERENAELRKTLTEQILLNQAVTMLAGSPRSDEMDTLVKDGKRLEWILSDAGPLWLSTREDIDKEMEESQ